MLSSNGQQRRFSNVEEAHNNCPLFHIILRDKSGGWWVCYPPDGGFPSGSEIILMRLPRKFIAFTQLGRQLLSCFKETIQHKEVE